MTATLMPPAHKGCNTHEMYRLSCAQYEGLLRESGQRCQICRRPSAEMPDGQLYIDHGGALGNWPVRGLLCISCNTLLKRDTAFSPAAACYLEDAWFIRQCRELQIPVSGRPEPAEGVTVRDNFGNYWVQDGGFWRQIRPDKAGRKNAYDWPRLNALCGPFNLHPVDDLGELTFPLSDLNAAASVLRARLPPELAHHLGRLLQAQTLR